MILIITSLFQSNINSPVGLSGYGAELAIKNTEYKAVDDSNLNKDESIGGEGDDDVHGFNLNTLK